MFSQRNYRLKHNAAEMVSFQVCIKETDLWIAVDKKSYQQDFQNRIENYIVKLRSDLEDYIKYEPDFFISLQPCLIKPHTPDIAKAMIVASSKYGVGPMAAVAGSFAEYVGHLLSPQCREIIIENGGDIFIKTRQARVIAIFAGASPLSNTIGIKISGNKIRGVCTSSGTVGPSLSLGKSDATVIVAKTPAIADAAATAIGNMVENEEDISKAIREAQKLSGILGALIVKGSKLGACGEIELVSLDSD